MEELTDEQLKEIWEEEQASELRMQQRAQLDDDRSEYESYNGNGG